MNEVMEGVVGMLPKLYSAFIRRCASVKFAMLMILFQLTCYSLWLRQDWYGNQNNIYHKTSIRDAGLLGEYIRSRANDNKCRNKIEYIICTFIHKGACHIRGSVYKITCHCGDSYYWWHCTFTELNLGDTIGVSISCDLNFRPSDLLIIKVNNLLKDHW